MKMEFSVRKRLSCCDGCLSINRELVPIRNRSDIMAILFGSEKNCLQINMMCWECTNMLTKIRMFKQRVLRAQGVLHRALINGMNELPYSLSNLCMKINTQIVAVCHEERSAVSVEDFDYIKEDSDPQEDYDSENCDKESLLNSDNEQNNDDTNTEFQSRIEDVSKNKYEISKRKYERKAEIIREKFTNIDRMKYFKKIDIMEEEIYELLEKERKNYVYLKRPFKCEKCVCSFVTDKSYRKHNERRHSKERGPYTCSVCDTNLQSRRHMHRHWKSHLQAYECVMCGYRCIHKNIQKSHLQNSHSTRYKCKMCSSFFLSRKEFGRHYKDLHVKLICDHCGRKFSMKRSIENHIKRNHGSRDCKFCRRHYKTYHSLENHYRMRHPFMISKNLKNEDSYCVECDKQFDSVYKYKNHLRTSVRHTPPKKISVPCPECGKVFSKTTYMKNHHKLAHIKQSEHHCHTCDKYFITAFSLRQHKQRVHDKIAIPKDKICNVCGRTFNANRNLIYHMRTHTGERPFSCEYCAASFAQKIAMKSHIKTVHLKDKVVGQILSSMTDTN